MFIKLWGKVLDQKNISTTDDFFHLGGHSLNALEISNELTPEERPIKDDTDYSKKIKIKTSGEAFHEKLEKNKKVNQGGSYRRKLAEKYSKPQRRGDKIQNTKSKKRK